MRSLVGVARVLSALCLVAACVHRDPALAPPMTFAEARTLARNWTHNYCWQYRCDGRYSGGDPIVGSYRDARGWVFAYRLLPEAGVRDQELNVLFPDAWPHGPVFLDD
jgi:hypothetical protein